ncbi:bacterioferritin-associated ferredoxin [Lacunimicrobium album]
MHPPDHVLCRCLNVQASDVRYLVEDLGIEDQQQIRSSCGAGTGCMSCRGRIAEYVRHLAAQRANSSAVPAGG